MTKLDELMPEASGRQVADHQMKPGNPASWMLFNEFTTTPVVHSDSCYICRDPEFAQMGLPLCRACPACGGHVAADDIRCDDCGLGDQYFYEALRVIPATPTYSDLLTIAAQLFVSANCTDFSAPLRSVVQAADALRKET